MARRRAWSLPGVMAVRPLERCPGVNNCASTTAVTLASGDESIFPKMQMWRCREGPGLEPPDSWGKQ